MLYAFPLTPDVTFILIFAAILVGLVVFLAVSVRRARKSQTEAEDADAESAEILSEDPEEDPDGDAREDWMPPEPEAYPARIVDMRVVTGNVGGHKRPKTGVSFLVTFLTDDGRRTEYPVPEELYVTLDLDQTGTLVILNGGFFDFGAGEEYDPAAVEEFERLFDPSEEES